MSQIRPITPTEKTLYNCNFQIINGQSVLNMNNKTLSIKTPVVNNNFTFVQAYNVSSSKTSAILFHITDNSRSASGNQMNYILENTFNTDSLNLNNIIDNKLGIIIFNDYPSDFNQNKVNAIKNLVVNHGLSVISSLCDNSINEIDDIFVGSPEKGCGGVLIA
ncbi:hypothetical protein [Mesonia aquimarina]|uniref:hypothetical protein n=1 Tax=Mesonia aquimarina TaxID=1504967 RepID=UPI000EF60663|nr:hypothetical protein [Mesonia aquimarina]